MAFSYRNIPGLPEGLNLVEYSDSEDESSESSEKSDDETKDLKESNKIVQNILSSLIKSVVSVVQEKKSISTQPQSRHFDQTCSSDDESSSESEEESSDEFSSSTDAEPTQKESLPRKPKSAANAGPKTKGEIESLPPIEDLHISVPREECLAIGNIMSIVNDLVVVKAFLNTPAIDLDSLLFLDNGDRPLGKVFDVFGPVLEPFYSVRFNSADHINEKAISKGMTVYFAPRTEHTAFVFVDQLRKMKGSDASWKNDEEPPENHLDFSDDEEERKFKFVRKHGTDATYQGNNSASRKRNHAGQNGAYQVRPSAANSNPFYRRNRRYNPRDYGPITWHSMHTGPANSVNVGPQSMDSALTPRPFVPPSNSSSPFGVSAAQRLPNPFSQPPPNVVAYTNHAFRYSYPPPQPPQ